LYYFSYFAFLLPLLSIFEKWAFFLSKGAPWKGL
jgi:hypothetical protein